MLDLSPATSAPAASNTMNRVLVVPWSMLRRTVPCLALESDEGIERGAGDAADDRRNDRDPVRTTSLTDPCRESGKRVRNAGPRDHARVYRVPVGPAERQANPEHQNTDDNGCRARLNT